MSFRKAPGRKMINDKVKFLLEIVHDSTNHKTVKDTARSVLHEYGLTNADIRDYRSKKEFVDELFEDDYWKSGERYKRVSKRKVEPENMESDDSYEYSVEKGTIISNRKLWLMVSILICMLITISLMIIVPVPNKSIRTEIQKILETTDQEGRIL